MSNSVGRAKINEIANPPKTKTNINSEDEQGDEIVGKKLLRMQKNLQMELSPKYIEMKTGGRTSRFGRPQKDAPIDIGMIPSDVAKFVTKQGAKSPKQVKKQSQNDENHNNSSSATDQHDIKSSDNKENVSKSVPESSEIPVEKSDIVEEIEIAVVKEEKCEEPPVVVQSNQVQNDVQESFSKSPSEDPQSDGEKGGKDFSDTDSALGSSSSCKNSDLGKSDFKIGQILWGSLGRCSWFPCMVYPTENGTLITENGKQSLIHVKWFNYNGMVADVPIRNVFEYGSIEAFWQRIQAMSIKKSKVKSFGSKTCFKAMEEANFFQKYPISKRKDLLDEVIAMSGSKMKKVSEIKLEDRKPERKSIDSALDIASPAPMSPTLEFSMKNDPILDYIETMQQFESLHSIEIKKEKKDRKSEVIKVEEEPKKEEDDVNRRRSGRVVKKRKFEDFEQEDVVIKSKPQPTAASPASEQPTQAKVKRPRVTPTLTLEERFTVEQNDLRSITRNLTKKRTCFECLQNTNQATHRCVGNGSLKCNGWFHETCCGKFEKKREAIRHTTGDSDEIIETNLIKVSLVCKNCTNSKKNCMVCSLDVVSEDSICEIFQCPNQECRSAFHKGCLSLWPQTNGSSNKKQIFCPQHTCHTCFYKEIHNTGPLMKCLKCPSAYHSNITCIPAGTKILSQSQVICPRHPTAKELKVIKEMKPLNIDWCHMCMDNGNLVCCDYCPNAFHPECISYSETSEDEKFMCRECQEGRLPLYNTIVWTRVGAYRWWPGLIVPESMARGTPKYEREFCIKFFGSNDFFWTTSERAYDYDGSTFLQRNKNSRLDTVFNVALEEAQQWSETLKNQGPDISSSKPKPYTKITSNRPILPVKLKKNETMQACGCKPTDPDPCGRSSDCINMHLNFECSKETCPAGENCRNQKLANRDYAELKIVKTPHRGFGAVAVRDLPNDTFIIEYVGELIDSTEMNRRMENKMKNKEKDFYFLTIEGDLYVDAEPSGNLARFINHSCDPNCETRKMTVEGNTRIGIFTKKFVKAGTELTFDYKMEFIDNKKTSCYCGTEKCSGLIGEKPKETVVERKPLGGISLKKKSKIRRSASVRDSTSSMSSSISSSTPQQQQLLANKRRRTITKGIDPMLILLDTMLDDPKIIIPTE